MINRAIDRAINGMSRVLGVTATRRGLTTPQAEFARATMCKFDVLHHGDCVGGDKQLHGLGREAKLWIIGHPPVDPTRRAFCICDELREEKEFLARNRDIVEECDQLYGFPETMEEVKRSGTWYTIREAKRTDTPFLIILPDGTTRAEI